MTVETNETNPAAQLSPEEARRRAEYSHRISAAFGEIVSVLMRSHAYRQLSLAGLEQLVVPAVITGQFFLAESRSKENGFTSPVGCVLWASVSDEVLARLEANLDKPMQLAPAEWRSGNNIWMLDAVGDARVISSMLSHLHKGPWAGRVIKTRIRGNDGLPVLKSLEAPAAA